MRKYVGVSELLGKTVVDIRQDFDDELIFRTACGRTYKMYHEQDCCERVWIEDIAGNLADLIGQPMLMAEEVSEDHSHEGHYDSCTWTFYKFATINGYVTIRWVGESNGYYSETVDFALVDDASEGK